MDSGKEQFVGWSEIIHHLMRRSLLTLAVALFFHVAVAQEDPQYGVPKLEDLVKIPPSPEAQAFSKYGNTPVNLFSGTPDVSIPIYTVQGKEFSIPVTLTYDASGIKVDQTATWAGLGWNLAAGGMITRQVRGKPDDYVSAHFAYLPFYTDQVRADYKFVVGFPQGTQPAVDWARYISFMETSLKSMDQGNLLEFQQDTYSLSAPGISGTIYINYDSMKGYCMEHPEWKIEPSFASSGGTIGVLNITEWRITDEAGNYFVFELPEVTYVTENNSWDGSRTYNSAWALTRIESKNKLDTISFLYETNLWDQPRLAGRSEYRVDFESNNTDCGVDNLVNPALEPTYKIQQVELSTISLNGNVVVGITAKDRLDLAGKGAVKAILIQDPGGNLVKKWKFVHSYFQSVGGGNENNYRLKLDRLEAYGSDTTAVPQQYRFEYYLEGSNFPSRESFSQDLWGYYNGVTANTTLIPYNYAFDKQNQINLNWKGADRRPNLALMKIGALQSVQYPTGGTTEFHYDPHRIRQEVIEYQVMDYITNFGMTGGTQTNNVFNYTDDQASPTPGYPMGQSGYFNVVRGGLHQIRMDMETGEGLYVPGWAFAAIYRTGDVDCDENGNNCNYGVEHDFDYIYNTMLRFGEVAWYFYGGVGFNMSNTVEVDLPAGAYRFLFLNTDSHCAVNIDVTSVAKEKSHMAGGLRVAKIVDKDETGAVASTKLYYYDDLSLRPVDSVSFALSNASTLESGVLHATPEFEEDTQFERYVGEGFIQTLIQCWKKTRYGNSQLSSDQNVTYPIVTEVQLGADDRINGFVVSEFATGVGYSRQGYVKGSPINGRVLRKRTYNAASQLLVDERNSYTVRQVSNGTGDVTGIYFYYQNHNKLDTYVRHPNGNAGAAYVTYDPTLSQDGQETRCGISVSGHTTYDCFPSDGIVQKSSFSFTRKWATLDSVRTVQYYPNGELVTVRKTFYDNLSHYQPTRIEQVDSRGINHKLTLKYPHELAVDEPTNTIWGVMVERHRLNERLLVTATYGSNQPDFKQKTGFKSVTSGPYTRYLTDTIKVGSGTGPLEARIKFHHYDEAGNPAEVSRINDVRASYIWGYDKTYVVATATNAKVNEIFFTSFEYGADLGNASDSHTGLKCKTGGFSKTLTGITSNKIYLLTYWSKSGGVWSYNSVTVNQGESNSYTINISGQVDDVRFFPAGAEMTTYTYQPLVGIASVSDPNSVPTYFEYDSFGRLITVRDAKRQIVKTHGYNFINPDLPVSDNH